MAREIKENTSQSVSVIQATITKRQDKIEYKIKQAISEITYY